MYIYIYVRILRLEGSSPILMKLNRIVSQTFLLLPAVKTYTEFSSNLLYTCP